MQKKRKEKKIVARELYKTTCASVDTQPRTAEEIKKNCSLFLHTVRTLNLYTYTMANKHKLTNSCYENTIDTLNLLYQWIQ